MDNEFRQYVDFDGFFSLVYPFWNSIRERHKETLDQTLQHLNIESVIISGNNYQELANRLLFDKSETESLCSSSSPTDMPST